MGDSHRITFGKLAKDGTFGDVRQIKQSDVLKCPHVILMAEHYREDGSCRCDDPSHTEMTEWGYHWRNGGWS